MKYGKKNSNDFFEEAVMTDEEVDAAFFAFKNSKQTRKEREAKSKHAQRAREKKRSRMREYDYD